MNVWSKKEIQMSEECSGEKAQQLKYLDIVKCAWFCSTTDYISDQKVRKRTSQRERERPVPVFVSWLVHGGGFGQIPIGGFGRSADH